MGEWGRGLRENRLQGSGFHAGQRLETFMWLQDVGGRGKDAKGRRTEELSDDW